MSMGNKKMIMNEKYQAMKTATRMITFCCLILAYLLSKKRTTRKSVMVSTTRGLVAIFALFTAQRASNER